MILGALVPLPLAESIMTSLDELIEKVSDLHHRVAPVGGQGGASFAVTATSPARRGTRNVESGSIKQGSSGENSMLEDDEKPIRYHFAEDFVLDPDELVFLDKLEPGTMNWVRRGDIPEDAKTPELLQAFVPENALAQDGEAWRAMTERGELLYVFSVYDLAMELSGKKTITMHPNDQYFLAVAHERLSLPPLSVRSC
jgi:hypothetical protein